MKIFNNFKVISLFKAYTEGIYADTPANRKLGRVGMTYAAYAEKVKKEKESNKEKNTITKKEGEKRAAEIIKKQIGFDVDFTFRKEKEFTISFEGNNKSKISKLQKLFKNGKIESEYDEELDETFVYIDLNNTFSFTFEEIKEKVNSEIKKLKRKNDFITISTENGYTFRFSRNTENGKFNECLVKDKEDKNVKTFQNSDEEKLIDSVSKYIQNLNVDIVKSSQENNEEINKENNISSIKKKMQEAKDRQTGTIIIKGSGDKLIYLNRERNGRWLKDFNSYTIRDSKRNVLSQGKVKTEEEFINKLSEDLTKNKIQLEL